MTAFRDLKAKEIEVRVGVCNEKGCSLLLYKDARVDRAILDETVGPERWQNKFYEIKGNLFCSVGLLVVMPSGDMAWIWKDDAGAPSNMEAEKGEASDAFKRACFKWGIGVELYSAPFIWFNKDNCNIKTVKNGKHACYDKFSVQDIVIENKEIVSVTIKNETKNVAFIYGPKAQQQASNKKPQQKSVKNSSNSQQVEEARQALNKTIEAYCERHGADVAKTKAGIAKRPDYQPTVEFYQKAAKEFME